MTALSVLGIAVAKGRAGYVYLSNGDLRDWQVSLKAVSSGTEMAGWVQERISDLKPDVVVTEVLTKSSRKGDKTQRLIAVAADTASHNSVLDVSVARAQNFSCKYEEAAALAELYPELHGWVPRKRRLWDSEPRNTILFEALALACAVIDGPPENLAAAMG